jgi:hypothetical protein
MIGSIREKPMLMLANTNVSITSHLCGFRYFNNIFMQKILEIEMKDAVCNSKSGAISLKMTERQNKGLR